MKTTTRFEYCETLERAGTFLRVVCFLVGCVLVCFAWNADALGLPFYKTFVIAALIPMPFLAAYAGVVNPITKTFRVAGGFLAVTLGSIPGLETPVEAHLSGDTSNPNYKRYNE